jgi:hypothetical protein
MKVEHPAAWHFIMQEDLYFLNREKGLYENPYTPVAEAIIEAVVPVATIEVAIPAKLAYLGKNNKEFLVLVHYPELEFIAEAHLSALENILKRKGFELDDVAILNMDKHSTFDFETLQGHFKPQKMLLLGKSAIPGGFAAIKLNEPIAIGSMMALYSFSFDEMMDSNELKKAFWDQMKNL